MFEEKVVSFKAGEGFDIANAVIVIDKEEFDGVHLAVTNLANDFTKVTGHKIDRLGAQSFDKAVNNCIVIGTLQQSQTIKALRTSGKIDTSRIDGKWETWMTVCISEPFRGYRNALVIIGSDKRGAIYGTYALSEQIGVSPWHWWADVPPTAHSQIFALPLSTVNGEPSVKYRGIFINDESPAMDSWAQEKFGPVFNSKLYEHIFELLLRLKANFLWPAMWRGYPYPGRSFFVDDPKNQALADKHGIVIGTSHHEPMQRAMNEWSTTEPQGTWDWQTNRDKIVDYFDEGAARAVPFESYFTMGMRGEGDGPISGDNPAEILTDVVETQRNIIEKKYGKDDGVPQLMALYKEVQEYYDDGWDIPDDVTLLFADDNFGSIRRLPTPEEAKRSGGVGFYYHFEYTGMPRSYRWMNSSTLGKVWQQLQLAHSRKADRIWIFNVGDLKPMELPMSFAFDLAWNVKAIHAHGFLDYFQALGKREFGSLYAERVGNLWHDFDRLLALRKHEHITPETFSLLNYHEAEIFLARWQKLWTEAEAIYAGIFAHQKPAFFQLVLHPIKASYLYVLLRISQQKNRLFALQRRNTTNALFHECIRVFDADHELSEHYHTILDGKWNHILRQPHYGYGPGFEGPSRDMISGLCYVQTKADSNPSLGHMGVAVEGDEGVHPGVINEDSDRTHPSRGNLQPGLTLPYLSPYGPKSRYFEIFHRGTKAFTWKAIPQHSWIKLSQYEGRLEPDEKDVRITISISWENVPEKFDDIIDIEICGTEDGYERVHLPVKKRYAPDDFTGFVESDGCISIDAGNWVRKPYVLLPSMGRPLAGTVVLPLDANFSDTNSLPFLHYDIYTFTEHDNVGLELHFNMTLDTDPTCKMEYDLQWDDGKIPSYYLTETPSDSSELPNHWSEAVQDCVWQKVHNIGRVEAGAHTIKIRFKAANVCLEKVVLNTDKLRYSYLGPPESSYVVGKGKRRHDIGLEDDLEMILSLK